MATKATKRTPEPDAAIPPGEFLVEEIAARGMTQRDLAVRVGRPAQTISEICNGRKAITADTALDLEGALGIPANLWLSMESRYRLALARKARRGVPSLA